MELPDEESSPSLKHQAVESVKRLAIHILFTAGGLVVYLNPPTALDLLQRVSHGNDGPNSSLVGFICTVAFFLAAASGFLTLWEAASLIHVAVKAAKSREERPDREPYEY